MIDEDLWIYHLYAKEQNFCCLRKLDRYFNTRADLENYLIEFAIKYFERFPEEDSMNELYIENARAEIIVRCTKLSLELGGCL